MTFADLFFSLDHRYVPAVVSFRSETRILHQRQSFVYSKSFVTAVLSGTGKTFSLCCTAHPKQLRLPQKAVIGHP